MEYGFATLHSGEEIFHANCTGLSGTQVIVEEHEDSTITHRFEIADTIKVRGDEVWYRIHRHTVEIDKTKALRQRLDEQADALIELASLI